jgi:ribA/ribD-fused uncharacterized protein
MSDEEKKRDNVVTFWGKKDYLSNFYPSPFTVGGVEYPNNETYFMKMKQERYEPKNKNLGQQILDTDNPADVKKLGRKIKNFDEDDWSKVRYKVMKKGLKYKFKQNPKLMKKLLSTGDKLLVEASPYDKVWGVGLTAAQVKRGEKFNGKNLLGKALMEIRAKYSHEEESE